MILPDSPMLGLGTLWAFWIGRRWWCWLVTCWCKDANRLENAFDQNILSSEIKYSNLDEFIIISKKLILIGPCFSHFCQSSMRSSQQYLAPSPSILARFPDPLPPASGSGTSSIYMIMQLLTILMWWCWLWYSWLHRDDVHWWQFRGGQSEMCGLLGL